MVFGRSAILSTFICSIVLNLISADAFVLAQPSPGSTKPSPGSTKPSPGSTKPSPGSTRPSDDSTEPSDDLKRSSPLNAKRANYIQNLISQNQQVKTLCSNARKIDFELTGDTLLIITGNHFCSYTIIKEVLQPQLKAGKIRTYAFTGDQEDVIVTF